MAFLFFLFFFYEVKKSGMNARLILKRENREVSNVYCVCVYAMWNRPKRNQEEWEWLVQEERRGENKRRVE